ncbi:MAG: oligosaccharide flippase family protein [Patescibacteria group bacterium]
MAETANTKKFTADVGIRFIAQILLKLRALVFLPIISKKLGAEEYGIWTQITLTISLLVPIFMLRLETACIRFLNSQKDKANIKNIFFSSLFLIWLLSAVISIIVILFKNTVSFVLFGEDKSSNLILLFVILVLAQVTFQFVLNYYRAFNKIKQYSSIEVITSFFELFGIIILIVFFNTGIRSALIVMITVELITSFFIIVNIFKELGFTFEINVRKYVIPLFKFSYPLILTGLTFWIINMSDRFMIVHLIDVQNAGFYTASYNLAGLIMFFLTPISFTLFPVISQLWEEKRIASVTLYMEKSLKFFLLISIPLVVIISYYSQKLLVVLATEEFITSRLLIFLIAAGYLSIGVYQIFAYIFHLKNKTNKAIPLFIFVSILNIVLNFILIPKLEILGAALSTFISYLILMLLVIIITKKWLIIRIPYIEILKYIVSALVLLGLLMFFKSTHLGTIILASTIGLIVYSLLVYILKGVDKKEIEFLKTFFNKSNTSNI